MMDTHSIGLLEPATSPQTSASTGAQAYVGRFAPSPSGPLHAGSLVAAMASYLDARAHLGRWLLRIEDLDEARCSVAAAESILSTLGALGFCWDGEVVWQSRRHALYEKALARLLALGLAYPCACSRREIADSRLGVASDGAAIYPGTCRAGLAPGRVARATRLRVPDPDDRGDLICFDDRWLGHTCQHLASEAGDFVLRRADGFWAYQLAVVVDDADQGITDIVRGTDLLDSTARQIYQQRLLGLPTPCYLHVPVVLADSGEKLSKQTGAAALDTGKPLETLMSAAAFLGLDMASTGSARPASLAAFWDAAVAAWGRRFMVQELARQ